MPWFSERLGSRGKVLPFAAGIITGVVLSHITSRFLKRRAHVGKKQKCKKSSRPSKIGRPEAVSYDNPTVINDDRLAGTEPENLWIHEITDHGEQRIEQMMIEEVGLASRQEIEEHDQDEEELAQIVIVPADSEASRQFRIIALWYELLRRQGMGNRLVAPSSGSSRS